MKKSRIIDNMVMKAVIHRGSRALRKMKRNAASAEKVNERLLLRILRNNRNCEYGRKYGFDSIRTVEEFKRRIPVITYKDIEEYVDRTYSCNEQNLITSDRVMGFATSSGSIGKSKIIPRTEREIKIYTEYAVARFCTLIWSAHRPDCVGSGTGLGICMLYCHKEKSPFGLVATNVADIVAKKFYRIYPHTCILPYGRQFSSDEINITYSNARFGLEDRNCMFIFSVFIKNIAELVEYIRDNWALIVDDIRNGSISEKVFVRDDVRKKLLSQLEPNPERADELKREFDKGFDETILSRIWPNMKGITAIGGSGSFGSFTDVVERHSRGIARDFSVYGASEGLFAACHQLDDQKQLMLPDSCYFEFIPADMEDEHITETLSLSELNAGSDYEMIVTNQSGLYRYRIGDVVHVNEYMGECPVITFAYRKGELLNINGEKTNHEMMTEAISMLEKKINCHILHWTAFVDRGPDQYRYAVTLEMDGIIEAGDFAEDFEEYLRQVNTAYRYYEGKGLIDPPVLLCQRPGTHDEWKRYKIKLGASAEQIKPVYVLDTYEKKNFFLSPDRIISQETETDL